MKRSALKRSTPLKRTGRLRPISAKRAALKLQVGPRRKAFVEEVGECMVCGRNHGRARLSVHEIASGPAREEALSRPELWLCVCVFGCHAKVQHMPHAQQFALQSRYWLERAVASFNAVRSRPETALTVAEVTEHLTG
jgi:hypothetical protein